MPLRFFDQTIHGFRIHLPTDIHQHYLATIDRFRVGTKPWKPTPLDLFARKTGKFVRARKYFRYAARPEIARNKAQKPMATHFPLKLVDSRMLADDVRHLVFQRADGELLNYLPGQFLQIHFEANGAATKRSYSLANPPAQQIEAHSPLEIAVSYVKGGAATALLSSLAHGGEITGSGPYGRFCLMDSDQNARYLLIGTGTGITPYRAMLPKLAELFLTRNVQVALIQGARTHAELLYGAEFQAFAGSHPNNFRYYACTSRAPVARYHGDRAGHVQSVFAELALNGSADIAYLCGNPNMVDECFTQLKDAGFPVPAVRREKYVSSK
jgi:ferredoxin-NADP reductase